MKIPIAVSLLFAFGAVTAVTGETRITGGTKASPGEFPYIVSLQKFNATTGTYKHFCAGTIYDTTHIVTAGHCVYNQLNSTQNIQVVAGAYDITKNETSQQRVTISSICLHPNYTSGGSAGSYDIAVLTLNSSLTFNNFVSGLNLSAAGHFPSGNCIIPGWGNQFPVSSIACIGSNTLLKATTAVMSPLMCSLSYPGYSAALKTAICASATLFNPLAGTCQGDSGGPFICSDGNNGKYLAGVVSWGYVWCATLPSVYSDVGALRGFLDSALAGMCTSNSTVMTQ